MGTASFAKEFGNSSESYIYSWCMNQQFQSHEYTQDNWKTQIHTKTYTWIFIAAILRVTQKRKPSECPSNVERDQTWLTSNTSCTCHNLNEPWNTTLWERSKSQKITLFFLLLIYFWLFWDRVLLCSSGWSWTCVPQPAGLTDTSLYTSKTTYQTTPVMSSVRNSQV